MKGPVEIRKWQCFYFVPHVSRNCPNLNVWRRQRKPWSIRPSLSFYCLPTQYLIRDGGTQNDIRKEKTDKGVTVHTCLTPYNFHLSRKSEKTDLMAYTPNKGLKQPLHPLSLIRIFAVHEETVHPWLSRMGLLKILIRRKCAGWSESSLGAHVVVTFSLVGLMSCIVFLSGPVIILFSYMNWNIAFSTVLYLHSAKTQISLCIWTCCSVFAVRLKMFRFLATHRVRWKKLINVCRCAGWSESLLDAHPIQVFGIEQLFSFIAFAYLILFPFWFNWDNAIYPCSGHNMK